MEENYLLSLFVVVIFSFVLFKKDKKVTIETSTTKERESYRGSSGSTSGVAKYLKNQQDEVMKSKVSGVAKYLQEKENADIAIADSLAVSSVEKYLATKQQAAPVSGVSKYMARQAVHQKKMAKENVSGVEKYLNNRS